MVNLSEIIKTNGEPCADTSFDGNPVTSDSDLNLIQIGWNIGDSFTEQVPYSISNVELAAGDMLLPLVYI